MNIGCRTLLIVLLGGFFGLVAMEDTASKPIDDYKSAPNALSEGYYVGLPSEVKMSILFQLLGSDPAAKALGKVGPLRRVCKDWNVMLHDARFLKNLFQQCQYNSDGDHYKVTLEYLRRYIGSILAKKEHTNKERKFLALLQSNTWTLTDLLFTLVCGLEVTPKTLASNPELLRCVLALFVAAPGRQEDIVQVKIMPLLTHEGCMLGIKADLERICREAVSSKKEEFMRAELKKNFSALLAIPVFEPSEQLSYDSLALFFLFCQRCKLRAFLEMDSQTFYQHIKDRCILSEWQEKFLISALEGNCEALNNLVQDRKGPIQVLIDIGLILALKSNHEECISLLLNIPLAERPLERETHSAVLLLFLAAVKHSSSATCQNLVTRYLNEFIRARSSLTFFTLFSVVTTEDELMKVCDIFDVTVEQQRQQWGGPDSEKKRVREWLTACFNQDLDRIKMDSDDMGFFGAEALALCSANGLNRSIQVLLPLLQKAKYLEYWRVGLIDSDFLMKEVRLAFYISEEEMRNEDHLKPEWAYNFLKNLPLESGDRALVDAALEGNTEKVSLLVKSSVVSHLGISLAILGSLSKENAEIASLLIKRLPIVEDYSAVIPENAYLEKIAYVEEMNSAIYWAVSLAYHCGFENICEALLRSVVWRGDINRVSMILLEPSLSYKGFVLAYKKLITLICLKIPSEEWFQGCWNDDLSLIKTIAADEIPDFMIDWACKKNKIELLKHLFTSKSLKDGSAHILSWAKKKHPRIAAFLKAQDGK